jgi:hypothetical protein
MADLVVRKGQSKTFAGNVAIAGWVAVLRWNMSVDDVHRELTIRAYARWLRAPIARVARPTAPGRSRLSRCAEP